MHGTFKGYDVDKKQVSFTDHRDKDGTFPMGSAEVVSTGRQQGRGHQDRRPHPRHRGKAGDAATLKSVMVEHK